MPRYSTRAQNKTLTNPQIRPLILAAKRAYDIAHKHGLTDLNFEEWRHEEAVKATTLEFSPGVTISQAVNGDFNKLKAHFLNLAGDTKGALEALNRDATEAYRNALWALDRELSNRGLTRGYAEKICQDTYHCDLKNAKPQQLVNLSNTIRSRRNHATQGASASAAD
jgi:hypothetical protein